MNARERDPVRLKAVAFDFGQTLGELDHDFMAKRLLERGVRLDPRGAAESAKNAWLIYGQHKDAGHAAGWQAMMEAQLVGGGVATPEAKHSAAWLWAQQPLQNLWRRPVPGMIELVRELRAAKVPVGIISNSEGHLAELVAELGWSGDFDVIVDSGKIGIDKPDPRIFRHACAALGVDAAELLHVGDAWEADVQGALGVSASAVWFDPHHRERQLPTRVYGAGTAAELREVLARAELLS